MTYFVYMILSEVNKRIISYVGYTNNLKNRIKENIGLSIEVNVSKKGSVPRSEGKAVRVVDER